MAIGHGTGDRGDLQHDGGPSTPAPSRDGLAAEAAGGTRTIDHAAAVCTPGSFAAHRGDFK